MDDTLKKLRQEIESVTFDLLALLSQRGEIATRIGELKARQGLAIFDPVRESELLDRLLGANKGPFSDANLAHLFKEIFKATAALMGTETRKKLCVHRREGEADRVVSVAGEPLGGGAFQVIAGPCAVESEDQLERVAAMLHALGVRILRAGAFKPRTSPYSFQGLRKPGLEILKRVADHHGLKTVSEVLDSRDVELVASYVDVLQVGTRNMNNFEMLRLIGQTSKPVLLKRGFMATIEELILAAEYIAMEGNRDIILCERGIRTFERWTRNTLDISAIPILKKEVPFPVVVDLSHSTGRRDIIQPIALASMAAGADGVMVEVHHNPPVALSDSDQQLNFAEFQALYDVIRKTPKVC
jgi:3-deoxy-7-phosphoheptulonate synthase / chorismate mutase